MRLKAFASACSIGAGIVAATAAATAGPAITLTPAGTKVEERGSTVVLMREGRHTVVSLQNRYRAPVDGLALLVPVKKGTSTKDVRVLPREVFARLEALSAPRLVELWELDPCEPQFEPPPKPTGVTPYEYGVDPAPAFVDGEYDIATAEGSTAQALKAWLTGRGYEVTPAVEQAVERAMKNDFTFVLARVDPSKVALERRGDESVAVLSPLRIAYESAALELPPGIGDSASGADVVITLSPEHRFSVLENETPPIPTNLDVRPAARDAFDAFYGALLGKQREKAPGSFITEYAWPTDACEPCATAPLDSGELLSLGADVIAGDHTGKPKVARMKPLTSTPVSQAAAPVLATVLLPCYRAALEQSPSVAGALTLTLKPRREFALDVSIREISDKLGASFKACADKALAAPLRISVAEGSFKKPVQEVRVELEAAPAPPPSRLVLTRLRAPSTAAAGPITLEAAPALAGGREIRSPAGALEQVTTSAGENHFQARYVIRHPWTDPIACAKPVRGRWGVERGRSATTVIAHPLPEGGSTAKLSDLLAQDVPELGIKISGASEDASPPAGAPSAIGSASPSSASDSAKGCACTIAGRERHRMMPLALFALLTALRKLSCPSRRRARACSRSRTP